MGVWKLFAAGVLAKLLPKCIRAKLPESENALELEFQKLSGNFQLVGDES